MKVKLLTFIVLLQPLVVNSQVWNFSLGNGIVQHKEELLQPIVYKGYNLEIGTNYSLLLKNNHLLFGEMVVSGIYTAKTKLGNDLSQVNLNVDIGYLFNTSLEKWRTGASLQSQYNYTLHSLNYEYPFWLTQYSLNWNNNFNFDVKEKYIVSISTSIPILALISRTPKEVLYEFKEDYTKAYFHRNMNFESLNNFRALTTSIFLSKKTAKKVNFRIGYRANFLHYRKPKNITRIYNSIVLSIQLEK